MDRSTNQIGTYFIKAAGILAFFIGMMSIIAGSMVLLGIDSKTYNTLPWLIIYNIVLGAISVFAAYFIWTAKRNNKMITILIVFSHSIILVYLRFFSDVAALESVHAMIFRVVIWLTIIVLFLIIPQQINRRSK